MHRDENATSTAYWAVNLDALQEHQFAYLGKDWSDFYFVRKMDWEYIIKRVATLDDNDMSDLTLTMRGLTQLEMETQMKVTIVGREI